MSEVPSQENRQFRLDRIVEVLELLSTSKEGVLLMDIVAALGIPTSTAYKLLAEMRRVGMIEATNGRGRQRLTKRMTSSEPLQTGMPKNLLPLKSISISWLTN